MYALSLGGHQGASSRGAEQKWPRRQEPCAEREVVENQGLKHHPRAPSQAYICPIMLEWTASCPARFSPPGPSPHLLPSWAPGPTQCASVAGMSDKRQGLGLCSCFWICSLHHVGRLVSSRYLEIETDQGLLFQGSPSESHC